MTIRIITDQYLAPSKMNRYKYEVVSRRSSYHGRVDVISSTRELHLSAGHTYYVRVNSDSRAPRVVKLFREVEG